MNDLKIERMKKEPKYIAFSTQKGGAGKTTLTVLVASYLHYVMDYNVAVTIRSIASWRCGNVT